MESSETDCKEADPMKSCSEGLMLWSERRGLSQSVITVDWLMSISGGVSDGPSTGWWTI